MNYIFLSHAETQRRKERGVAELKYEIRKSQTLRLCSFVPLRVPLSEELR